LFTRSPQPDHVDNTGKIVAKNNGTVKTGLGAESVYSHLVKSQRVILNFTTLFTPRAEHSLLFRRVKGQTENFTPRG
jgi:hypothetical protein